MRAAAAMIVVALVATAATAHAEETKPRAFGELPVGRFTAPPAKAPAFVPGGSKVRGLYLSTPNSQLVTITSEPPREAGLGLAHAAPRCLVERYPRLNLDAREPTNEWDEKLAGEANAFPSAANNLASGAMLVHTEQLVESGDTATLDVIDAAVDPNTRGARVLSKATLPLRLVHDAGFGLKVYAGRDERADGRRFVQFVAVRPIVEAAPTTAEAVSIRQTGDVEQAMGCAHQRVSVPVEPGAGNAATMLVSVVLPPRSPAADAVDEGAKTREVRTRMVGVQVSVSQTSTEKEPLVSVSTGWTGRETASRSFVASE